MILIQLDGLSGNLGYQGRHFNLSLKEYPINGLYYSKTLDQMLDLRSIFLSLKSSVTSTSSGDCLAILKKKPSKNGPEGPRFFFCSVFDLGFRAEKYENRDENLEEKNLSFSFETPYASLEGQPLF